MGPHNGGCGTCTGLVTVQEGGSRAGQVDNTIEYYTTGHLTKFVRPGAQRIDSTANGTVQNVAWRNTDGSKALIAHNGGTGAQSVRVVWGGQSFTYSLPGAHHRDVHLVRHAGRRRWRRRRDRPDRRARRQVPRRGRRQQRQRHRRAALRPATAPTRSSGRSAPTAPYARSASASTSRDNGTANGTRVQIWDCSRRREPAVDGDRPAAT